MWCRYFKYVSVLLRVATRKVYPAQMWVRRPQERREQGFENFRDPGINLSGQRKGLSHRKQRGRIYWHFSSGQSQRVMRRHGNHLSPKDSKVSSRIPIKLPRLSYVPGFKAIARVPGKESNFVSVASSQALVSCERRLFRRCGNRVGSINHRIRNE